MPATITMDRLPSNGDELFGHIDRLLLEADRFVAVAAAGPLDAPIANCPGWTMRDLVEHVGMVHLWAAANMAFPSSEWIAVDGLATLEHYWPDLASESRPPRDLFAWYAATLDRLIDVIRSMPRDHDCLTFLPASSPLVMWARRQAAEVGVHRYDAESARGLHSEFDPRFAIDMLDELLMGFAPKMRSADSSRERVLLIEAEDVGERYTVRIAPGGIATVRGGDTGHLHLTGSAADLNLLLWNRPSGSTIRKDGDADALQLWADSCCIRWI
ncbi:MAG: maleylpyruvate isomerase N-terminal domain-containing protein [Acidimicrobiia bacterium]|nr:maleylpyruvate isomerase N-terminal domain-containing protein [Acidimicrobiia bacterium]